MKNNINEIVSLLYNFTHGLHADADQAVCDSDNGEASTVQEGREHALAIISGFKDQIAEIEQDIKKMSLKNLIKKYGDENYL